MTKITTTIASERYRDTRGAKCWAKHVTRIDPSKTNGYAFIGEWVRLDQSVELPVDAVVLVFEGMTTNARFSATIRVLQATERGVAEIERLDTSDRGWALTVRPIIEGLLGPVEVLYRVSFTAPERQTLKDAVDALTNDSYDNESVAAEDYVEQVEIAESILTKLGNAEEVR